MNRGRHYLRKIFFIHNMHIFYKLLSQESRYLRMADKFHGTDVPAIERFYCIKTNIFRFLFILLQTFKILIIISTRSEKISIINSTKNSYQILVLLKSVCKRERVGEKGKARPCEYIFHAFNLVLHGYI